MTRMVEAHKNSVYGHLPKSRKLKCTGKILHMTEHLYDMNTDSRLLPLQLIENTNSKRIAAYKIVMKMAMLDYLSHDQRQLLHEFYWNKKTKSAIAKEIGVTDSAVCKRIKAAESTLRQHMEFIEKVYDVFLMVGRDDA